MAGTAEADGGQALGWLKIAWGDAYEGIRRTPDGAYQARCRSGDGETVTAGTPEELDRALRDHWENSPR